MQNFWDERFSSDEYVYGTRPNVFFKMTIDGLTPGKILFPAEGEGRNAVYAAKLGWDVTAYDTSSEGIRKALKLASGNRVDLMYILTGHQEFQAEPESFDCIVLIYAHFAPGQRQANHKKLSGFLKPGGTIILEGFSKQQLSYNTGGPGNLGMLFSKEEIEDDFQEFSNLDVTEQILTLDEGRFHQGQAAVIRMVGKK